MTSLFFQGNPLKLQNGETVLDCLLRHDIEISFSCKGGVCQNCMVHVLSGDIPDSAQVGLKPSLKTQRYALACSLIPKTDIEVELPQLDGLAVPVEIDTLTALNASVKRVILRPKQSFACFPGQYINLIHNQIARSYSVANDPVLDGQIELHIGLIPNGQMSNWIHHLAKPGDQLYIRGPIGDCFYVSEENVDYPILLAGTGTGLAPLIGISEDALRKGHKGPIHLYHGAKDTLGLYHQQKLRQLASAHAQFNYQPCVLFNEEEETGIYTGDMQDYIIENLANPKETRVFLCGAPDFVASLRKKVFMAGVGSKHIYSDPFLYAAPSN